MWKLELGVVSVTVLLCLVAATLAFMNAPEIIAEMIDALMAPKRPQPPTLRQRIAEPVAGPTSSATRLRLRQGQRAAAQPRPRISKQGR